MPTPAVRNLIREGKTHQIYSALQTGGTHGMQTMDAALADLVRRDKITRELAEQRSSHPEELRRLMGTVQGGLEPMATFAFKALDLAGARTRGEIEGDDKQAVASQLRSKGLIVVDIEEQIPKSAADILARFRRVKAGRPHDRHAPALDDGLVGHVAAARAVRDRGADRERQAEGDAGPPSARTSRPASRSRTRSSATRTSSTTSTWRWWPRARPAASWSPR